MDVFRIPVKEGGVVEVFNDLFRMILDRKWADVILIPQLISGSGAIQQTLIKDKDMIRHSDPLSPFLPVNSATLVSRLTKGQRAGKIFAVMRPCEIRAFVELVKLNQGSFDGLTIMGIDCPGTFDKDKYRLFQKIYGNNPMRFYKGLASGDEPESEDLVLRNSCNGCIRFTPEGADIIFLLFGSDIENGLFIDYRTEKGKEIISQLELERVSYKSDREAVIDKIMKKREAFRKTLMTETRDGLLGIENLINELSLCINCHNCMKVCPLCYCKQCVFDSPTFDHEPIQYMRWAERKGAIKMPTDTLFFHLTRMAHMGISCVGCGQCSMACPMGIRVAEIFSTVASITQGLFQYEPGRDRNEPIPITIFRERELHQEEKG